MECQDNQIKCWIWPDPNLKWQKAVTEYVKSKVKTSDSCVLLSVADESFCNAIPLMKFLISVCRKYELFHNEHTTLLNSKDHFLATQLCIANLNKKEMGEFGAAMSDVVYCLKKYVDNCNNCSQSDCPEKVSKWVKQYKDFLQLSNTTDEWQMLLILQHHLQSKTCRALNKYFLAHIFIILGVPSANILRKAFELFTVDNVVNHITVESTLDESLHGDEEDDDNICVVSEIVSLESCITYGNLNSTANIQSVSASEEYVEEIIQAFLCLLVNCRDELALAKVMVSPILNLSHTAFTDLKRHSARKELPMCQAAVSHVMCVRLGGKSYAPPKDCSLWPHMKGLGEFVDLLDQLQTVLDEDPSLESSYNSESIQTF